MMFVFSGLFPICLFQTSCFLGCLSPIASLQSVKRLENTRILLNSKANVNCICLNTGSGLDIFKRMGEASSQSTLFAKCLNFVFSSPYFISFQSDIWALILGCNLTLNNSMTYDLKYSLSFALHVISLKYISVQQMKDFQTRRWV